ncbi:HesA/MoeB/ThiF family protein [Belliella sp. R4-6]|uniref:HesA/MoeB/ThiF family protein n=1 Tax=Belliella alkalica TaxID=1730871 RepID=A0ABS9V7G7_9BACT|nr:HesA/MoeB/ThiF family protein [Belliella alkalica]MCH7412364.1 HesA/MoeB/ThiF family protein [Belliella alkalica]
MEELEMNRYSRQIMLPEFGLASQEKLRNAKILVIGAGGLGCPILQYLTAGGVGQLGIVDNDRVALSNLHRQILYNSTDIGKAKAHTAAKRLAELNPYVKTKVYDVRLNNENAKGIFEGYDLVIDGSDNFFTRYLVNDTCVEIGIPLIFGSILKFEGQISVFNYQDGPQYRDLFPEPPPSDEVPNCSEIGVIGILPGLIGMYMANEAIKVICGLGETLSGKLMVINTLSNQSSVFKIQKRNRENIIKSPANKVIDYPEMDYATLQSAIETDPDGIIILDVREPKEFKSKNIGGINIPLAQLATRIKELPRDKKLVVCCQSGIRSKSAVNYLREHYSGEIFNLAGGISSISY